MQLWRATIASPFHKAYPHGGYNYRVFPQQNTSLLQREGTDRPSISPQRVWMCLFSCATTCLNLCLTQDVQTELGRGCAPARTFSAPKNVTYQSSAEVVLCLLTADGDVSCCGVLCSYCWRVSPWHWPPHQRRLRKYS